MSELPSPTEPLEQDITSPPEDQSSSESAPSPEDQSSSEPAPSYTKLAMRNMVKKKGTSLKHFFLTTLGLLSVLIGLAYLTR